MGECACTWRRPCRRCLRRPASPRLLLHGLPRIPQDADAASGQMSFRFPRDPVVRGRGPVTRQLTTCPVIPGRFSSERGAHPRKHEMAFT